MSFAIYRTIAGLFGGIIAGNNAYNIPKPPNYINGNKEYSFDLIVNRRMSVKSNDPSDSMQRLPIGNRLSVVFGAESRRKLWNVKYWSVCIAKGIIYGFGFPIAIPMMINDYYSYNRMYFNRHLVPCSTYFVDKPSD